MNGLDDHHRAPSQKADSPLVNLMFSGHLRITLNVAAITLGTMGGAGALGYWLDMQFGTKPLLLILGLVLAFPLIQVFIYKKFKKMTADEAAKTKKDNN